MERERNKVQGYMRKCIAIFLLACPVFMAGQDHRSQIYDTYLSGRMDLWKSAIDEMESALNSSSDMALLIRINRGSVWIYRILYFGKKEEGSRGGAGKSGYLPGQVIKLQQSKCQGI